MYFWCQLFQVMISFGCLLEECTVYLVWNSFPAIFVPQAAWNGQMYWYTAFQMLLCCFQSRTRVFGRGLEESRIKATAATQAPKSKGEMGDNLYSKEQVVEYQNYWLIACFVFDWPMDNLHIHCCHWWGHAIFKAMFAAVWDNKIAGWKCPKKQISIWEGGS